VARASNYLILVRLGRCKILLPLFLVRMPKPFELTIRREGRSDIVVSGEFTDDEAAVLERYLEQYERLSKSKPLREGVPFDITIRVNDGDVDIQTDLPDNDTLDILLQRLRPFILQNQYASFGKATALLKRRVVDVQVRQMLDEQVELYDGRHSQRLMTLTSNEAIINSEKVLYDWLNSHEYHADPDKRERIDSLFARLSTPLLRGILVGMLLDKTDAIRYVATFIAVLMGRQNEVTVQSKDVRPSEPT
jgi:hypothetical protein